MNKFPPQVIAFQESHLTFIRALREFDRLFLEDTDAAQEYAPRLRKAGIDWDSRAHMFRNLPSHEIPYGFQMHQASCLALKRAFEDLHFDAVKLGFDCACWPGDFVANLSNGASNSFAQTP